MKAPKIISFDNYFKTLASEFSKCGCDQDFAEATEPQKLLFLYAFYHYFDADGSKIPDIISGCTYRETVDDHIAGVFIDSESDNEDVDILLVSYSENPEANLPAYYKFLDDAKNAYFCAIKKKSTRKELDFLGDDEGYKIGKGKRLNVCLLTNFSPKKAKQDEIRNNVRKLSKGAEDDVTFKVIFGYEIESECPFEYVKDRIEKILRVVIDNGKGIEVNTSSFRYGLQDLMPSREVLKLYKKLGGEIITIGSDSHREEQIGYKIPFIHEQLRYLGYKYFCTFDKMQPAFHKLN